MSKHVHVDHIDDLSTPDGRKTVVPLHGGRDIPRGLLRQIVTIDIGMDLNEFIGLL